MMAVASFTEHENAEALAEALSADIEQRLRVVAEAGGFPSLALSGGSTPKRMLERLGRRLGDVAEMVYLLPVDERISDDPARSNAAMIRKAMALDEHPDSEFLDIAALGDTAEDAAKRAEARLRDDEEVPFTVVTLGMGTDGHTASFFPGGDTLAQAVDPAGDTLFAAIRAPGAGEPRVTLTLPALVSAQHLVLHIEGEEKRRVWEKALQDGPADEMPVRHLIRHPDAALHVHWAP